ncbi:MFS transporter [Streptococcus sp. X16XC17]|nr:MFS transporter [Streptococcus sp. X16XC17]
MLGAVMRVPFTSIPAILTDIASGLGGSVSSLGILTSLPLLMFAFFSALAPRWAAKLGIEKLLGLVLAIMLIGSLLRMINLPMLYVGTMLIGVAVAVINVILPSLVSANFPLKVGFYTTLYITTMGISTTLASMVAVPITSATSWEFFLLLISALIGLALLIWLPNLTYNHRFENEKSTKKETPLWKNKYAVIFLIFGGLQSLLFYTEMTWLPTITTSVGLSQAEAGFLSGIFSLISIPVSMIVPSIVSRLSKEKRAWIMTGISALTLIGLAAMLVAPANFTIWLLIHLILGVSVSTLFPYMMISLNLKTSNSQDTARLSGMVQSGGYLLASVGPMLLGYSYSLFASWVPFIISLAIVTILMMISIVFIEKRDKII